MSSDCLVFDTNIAQIFTDNGNLAINVTISLCWPPSHLFQLLAISCLLLMMVKLPYSLFIFFRFYLTSRSELRSNFICGNCFSKRNIWYCKTRYVNIYSGRARNLYMKNLILLIIICLWIIFCLSYLFTRFYQSWNNKIDYWK